MISIENEQMRVEATLKGAELQSIFHKGLQLEYLWNADPAFWAKKSPILFPIVGTLKNDTFIYEGSSYHMARHGFARDRVFALEFQRFDAMGFLMKSDLETRKIFPFDFELRVRYSLRGAQLIVTYQVNNLGKGTLYFSIGGHPAFKMPLTQGTSYEDYYLEFNEEETLPRWPITGDGLLDSTPIPFLQRTNTLQLRKDLFKSDALVFKFPASSILSIKSDATARGLDFRFEGFPYLGIWAARGANFICLEPWCGISDSVDSDQQLISKEGICRLPPGSEFLREWSVFTF